MRSDCDMRAVYDCYRERVFEVIEGWKEYLLMLKFGVGNIKQFIEKCYS